MRIIGVVLSEIGRYSSESIEWRSIGISVYLILFQTPPETLSENIVYPSSFSVHTDSDIISLESSCKYFTGELRPLICIEYLWFPMNFYCFSETINTESNIHSSGDFPCKCLSRIPVNNSHEIYPTMFQTNVGDITSPYLIDSLYFESLQKVWIFFVGSIWNARILPWIQRLDTESIHSSSNHPSPSFDMIIPQECNTNTSLSEVRRLCIYSINGVKKTHGNILLYSNTIHAFASYAQ